MEAKNQFWEWGYQLCYYEVDGIDDCAFDRRFQGLWYDFSESALGFVFLFN